MRGLLHLVQRGWNYAGSSPSRPLLAVPNVTAHRSTTSVLIAVLLYNGLLFCGLNLSIKGLKRWSGDCKVIDFSSYTKTIITEDGNSSREECGWADTVAEQLDRKWQQRFRLSSHVPVSSDPYEIPRSRLRFGEHQFAIAGPRAWNTLPAPVTRLDLQ